MLLHSGLLLSFTLLAAADEARWERGLSTEALTERFRKLPDENQMPLVLRLKLVRSRIIADLQTGPNPTAAPWVAQINLDSAAYRRADREYRAAGYRLVTHDTVTANRRVWHSAVWLRDASEMTELRLPEGALPETGRDDPAFEPLNEMMRSLLQDNNIPGATIALGHDGRLLYSRGFGYSDVSTGTAMEPDARMRIASVSKPLTAVAILQLAERGVFGLDDPVLPLLLRNGPADLPAPADERWRMITVRNLLQHSGGWDRDVSGDPMFRGTAISRTLGLEQPPTPWDTIRWQLAQPLDFDPGERSAYSNFGYCLLGRVIETAGGTSYVDFVNDGILQPAGMQHTVIGRTKASDRIPGEVIYHTQKQKQYPPFWLAQETSRSASPVEFVPPSYGRWNLEAMDAHGGWVSSAPDLLRFLRQLHADDVPLLTAESRRAMLDPPQLAVPADGPTWYACGWNVRTFHNSDRRTSWHIGSLDGTSSILVRRYDGWSWAVLFNCDRCADDEQCAFRIDPLVHQAIARLGDLPDTDLFGIR